MGMESILFLGVGKLKISMKYLNFFNSFFSDLKNSRGQILSLNI